MNTSIELLECGHPESEHEPYTRGWGTGANGKRSCYDCCEAMDRALINAGEPLFAYVNDTNTAIVNWPGRKLMRITESIDRPRVGFGGRTYVRAIDHNGRVWSGSGPMDSGTYVRLRRVSR